MEGDSTGKKNKTIRDRLLDFSDVLQPSWVRCPICSCDEMDKFLLDYGRYFLFPFSVLLWIVLAPFI